MHIGILTPGSLPLPPSPCTSVEIYAADLAKTLACREHVTLYAYGKKEQARQRDQLTTRTFVTRGGLPYLRLALRDLKKRRPTLLQIENRIPYVTAAKDAFPRLPVVLNLHSNVLIQALPLRTVNRALERVDALVLNSEFLKKDLLAKYPVLAPDRVHVIHPGIDLHRFPSRFSETGSELRQKTRHLLRVSSDQIVLLYVGRFIPRKGIDVLLDAFRDVHAAHPDTELWIIGGKPDKTDNSFHRLIRRRAEGLPVRFHGFVRQSDLPAFYAAADLFVCPSQRPEAFGLVNLEASAAGLPVIATGKWGIREAVLHERSGLLVDDYEQASDFAAAISCLLNDPERLDEMGREARLYVEEHFAWSRTADQFRALYKRLNPR